MASIPCGPGATDGRGAISKILHDPDWAPFREDQFSTPAITGFESLAGKQIAWAYFSNNWDVGIVFPTANVNTVRATGAIPFIRMMAWSRIERNQAEAVYTMQRILQGDFDTELAQWARDARATGTPLMVEFGTEVTGRWFPWNGEWNGGGTLNGYGDPNLPDGPERFRDAYRHVIEVCWAQGADNITWVFHADCVHLPDVSWNSYVYYCPGDAYIDWLGISAYGAQFPGDQWEQFTSILDAGYAELAALSPTKPIAILEYATNEGADANDKATWIQDALAAVRGGRYPRVKAVSWWNERWENDDGSFPDLRINSSTEALNAYRQAIADPYFVSRATVR